MRILITGSTGFIGGSVGRFAAGAGHEVIGIARRSQADPGWPGRHVSADVAQTDLSPIIKEINPHVIFHGAGTASVGASFASPIDDFRAAAMTFANLLDGVRRSTLRPLVVFPSSAAVYGNPASLPVAEDAPTNPISPYGYHKLACEMIAREYAACFGVETIALRIFSVFGSAQRRLLVWEIFEQLSKRISSVKLRGSGHESRDYLHVDDLAAAVMVFGENRGDLKHNIFNLASGVETRVADLAIAMRGLLALDKRIEYLGREMSGDPSRWVAATDRTAAAVPGWKPRSLSVGLGQVLKEWSPGATAI